jgi:hypothetical protein
MVDLQQVPAGEGHAPGVLEWAEHAGIEGLKRHHDSATWVSKQATTTLAVLLAGMGWSLTYAMRVFEPLPGPMAWGSLAFCAYLSALAVLLTVRCLLVRPVPAVYNEPAHLGQPGWPLDKLREVELENIQARIGETAAKTAQVAWWLNIVRAAAIASPLVGFATAWLSGVR